MNRIRFSVPKVRRPHVLYGEILHIDRFGNLITNIRKEDISRAFGGIGMNRVAIILGGCSIKGLKDTYSEGRPKTVIALFGSYGYMEVAVSGGNAASALGAKLGETITVELRGK
jgi:hypothetical protein